jgi:hypothetical protein
MSNSDSVSVVVGADGWIDYDFTPKLRPSSIITDAEATATVLTGDDTNPGDIIDDVMIDASQHVTVRVHGQVAGVTYCVLAIATTSDDPPCMLMIAKRLHVTAPCAA